MGNILLKNILSDGRPCDIRIEGNVIRKITAAGLPGADDGDSPASSGVEVLDCTGKAAVPCFVNMHTHAAMTLMRGVGEDILFPQWIDKIWVEEEKIDEDYVYWGTKVACVEMIKTGTTTFYDHYWHIPAAYRAAMEMGMRPAFSYVFLDRYDRSVAERQKAECEDIYMQSLSWNDSASFSIALHSVYSVSEDLILWAVKFAREHNLGIHIHLSETEKEVRDCIREHGVSPVRYLCNLGALGPDLTAAHTLWLSDEDVKLLGDNGVTCVHNINSNLKLASGYRFRYRELADAGANVCIGTDGCASSNNLDILEAMKTSAIVQKAWRDDPSAFPLDELLAAATCNGAKALGLNCGKIAEGALADLMIVDTDNTFFLSNAPFLANFIYSAHSDCISSVICNGRFAMRNRIVNGEKEILSGARAVLEKLK